MFEWKNKEISKFLCKQVSCKKWVGVGRPEIMEWAKWIFLRNLKFVKKGFGRWLEKDSEKNPRSVIHGQSLPRKILFYFTLWQVIVWKCFWIGSKIIFRKSYLFIFYISSNIYYIFLETVKWGNLGHFYFISNLTSLMFLVQINYFNYVLETYARILQKMFPPKSLSHY
jgi:hypothetical protein